jgi:hypothetical protein
MRLTRIALFGLTLVFCALPEAFAQDAALAPGQTSIAPRAEVAAAYSDNALRANADRQSVGALEESVGVRVERAGPLNIDADLSMLHYDLTDNLPSENLPSGNVRIVDTFIPDRFSLTLEDNLAQISTEPFDVLSDPGRQTVNFLTLGPQLTEPLGSRGRLLLDGEVGTTHYETSNLDNKRYLFEAGAERIMSEASALSVNYRQERVEYDVSDLYPSTKSDAAFLRYSARSSRTFMNVELGVDSIQVGDGDRHEGPHAELTLQRVISARTTLNFELSSGYSDAEDSLRQSTRSGFNAGSNQNVLAVAQPFRADRAYTVLLHNGPRGSAAFDVTWEREVYQGDAAADRTVAGADGVVDYRLTPVLTLNGRLRWVRERFQTAGIQDDVEQLTLGLSRRLTRALQLSLVGEHTHGLGSSDLYRFSENRVMLAISYAPNGTTPQVFDPVSQFRYYNWPGAPRNLTAPVPTIPQSPALPDPDSGL